MSGYALAEGRVPPNKELRPTNGDIEGEAYEQFHGGGK